MTTEAVEVAAGSGYRDGMPELLTTLDTTYERWITTPQAAKRLGVSERTIRTWAANGTLRKAKRPQSGCAPIVILHPDDVAREEAKRRSSFLPPPAYPQNGPLALAPEPSVQVPLAMLLAARQEQAAPPPLNLDLDAAAEYSGLPKRLLAKAIKEGRLNAHRWGGVYYLNRDDLHAFRPQAAPRLQWSEKEA